MAGRIYFIARKSLLHCIPLDGMTDQQAASLLAVDCLANGNSLKEYVLVSEREFGRIMGIATKLLKFGRRRQNLGIKLTRRESEVLRHIVHGLANKEIGVKLNLSERTVKFHVSSLLAKFRVQSRLVLARRAITITAKLDLKELSPNGQ